MADVHPELEITYEIADDRPLPDLVSLAGPGPAGLGWSQSPPEEVHLEATYVDTADLDLVRAGLTLRRRTGGADAGWHLKVPSGPSERAEVRLPAGRAAAGVPDELQRMLRSRLRGATLAPVVRITTDRTVRRLVDPTGRAVLELADDRVVARRLRPLDGSGDAAGAEQRWREVELEALDGGAEVLAAADAALGEHGFGRASQQSKLARALGLPGPLPGPVAGGESRADVGPDSPAGAAVVAYVADQLAQIRHHDVLVRIGQPDSVHRMRVATRRLRSALVTFRRLFDETTVQHLRDELTWPAELLGSVRDAEVVRARVLDVADDGTGPGAEPASDGPHAATEGSSARRAAERLGASEPAAREALLAALDSERFHTMLDALDAFVASPPATSRADRPARRALRRGVARADRRVRRRVARVATAAGTPDRHARLHDVRKAAKRARYAAELASPALGEDAETYAAAMEQLQEVLGEHQDAVVLGGRLRALLDDDADADLAFTLGRLTAREDERVRGAEERFADVWAAAGAQRLRRWLR